MENNKEIQLDILDINSSGSGTAKIDGLVCFVPFCIDGERVIAKVEKQHKNFCIAKLESVVCASKDRVEPKCKYFGVCGGCDFQHINYQKQLETKTQIIKSMLNKAKVKFQKLEPTVPSEKNFAYRNKINFNIIQNKLCFFDQENMPLFVDFCPLFCDDKLKDIIFYVNKFLQNTNQNFKALHLRTLENQYNFCFVSNNTENCDFESLTNDLKNILCTQDCTNKKTCKAFSICTSENKVKNSSNIGNHVQNIVGDGKICVDKDLKFCVSPQSFLQTNTQMQNKIYDVISNQISPKQTVINAYGGAGLLSAILAKKSKFVYSVEISLSATKDCQKLFLENDIKNAEAICGDCKDVVPSLATQSVDTIVFDPARAGVDQQILKAVIKSKIQNIIYLSCNPQTFVRDAKFLEQSYNLKSVTPFDMFPQTKHIETLAVFEKK